MDIALMFNVLEGGESIPVKWGKQNFQPDRSIIILDEASLSIYLWQGAKLGLIARRTALRQAESLKGHGYTAGKSIIGRDIKEIKELDQRKISKDPDTDRINGELQELLSKKYKELDNFIVTFESLEIEPPLKASKAKPETAKKPEPSIEPKPKADVTLAQKKELASASEYESDFSAKQKVNTFSLPKVPEVSKPKESKTEDLLLEARKAFLILSVLDSYSDIWISRKKDGNIAIEMMEGPVCEFSIKEKDILYTTNSFSGVNPNIKTAILKKFQELAKLL
jgi:hypothetical protein